MLSRSKEREIIKRSFANLKEDISKINNRLGQIEESIKELRDTSQSTSRSTTRSYEETRTDPINKRAIEKLDKMLLLKSIKNLIDEGYRTCIIRDEIIGRFGIKETCFYKYLKLLRDTSQSTSRTTSRSTTRIY